MEQGEEHRWSTIRDQASERFGEHPGAQLEADVVEHFVEDPERVIRTIDRLATAHSKKPLGSPWAVLRADLNRAPGDVIATGGQARAKAIERAEQWIRNAGIHYDEWRHVQAELFGDEYAKGPLSPYAADAELRLRIQQFWQSERPRGEQAEADHLAWNEKCKADRHIVLALRSKPTSEDIDFT